MNPERYKELLFDDDHVHKSQAVGGPSFRVDSGQASTCIPNFTEEDPSLTGTFGTSSAAQIGGDEDEYEDEDEEGDAFGQDFDQDGSVDPFHLFD